MSRQIVEPTLDEYGAEEHPAWAVIGASRGSYSPPGAVLFDSDIRHQHVVTVRIKPARRSRDLHHDHIMGTRVPYIEVMMSEAQWASFVSSMNTGDGVPATVIWRDEVGEVPATPYEPRLAESMDEVKGAALKAQSTVQAAFKAYEEHKNAANLRTLKYAIENLPANLSYSAKVLSEHAENVVQRARADIEAFVVSKARQVGLDPAEFGEVLQLNAGDS